MKLKVKGWITPEGYAGTVLKGEVVSRALRVDLELELDDSDGRRPSIKTLFTRLVDSVRRIEQRI